MSNALPCLIYLNASHERDRIFQMTFAGIHRYANARGWRVDACWVEEPWRPSVRAILDSRAPVVGCVVESGGTNPVPPEVFGDVPAVCLHMSSIPVGNRVVHISTDNEAVARAAFRELSAGRPAAFAVVGNAFEVEWSSVRERVFAKLAVGTGLPCLSFPWRDESDEIRSRRLATWVAMLPCHTAVFAVNDVVATETVAAARAAGRAIPRELTLLGVDNRKNLCETSKPTISSIQIDFERAGYVAARTIGEMVAGKKVTREKSAVIGPLLAVRRESTGGWGRREAFVLKAVERIRREACGGLSANDVIVSAPVSRSLFILRFREAVGHSVLDEIHHVRLQKVCTLLAETDTDIGAIAGLCGFRSERALRKLFRLREGMSMQAWRARNRRR
jgi:LacI family transcriptional regulator